MATEHLPPTRAPFAKGAAPADSAEFVPFVCPLVLARMTRGGALELPHVADFPALVMRTDISGFTTLTEALHARGPAGVEELSRILDRYFMELIDLVSSSGGTVVKFAGDALIATWPLRHGDVTGSALVVVQCARAIQSRFASYRIDERTRLAMRIGIGTGETRHFILGGVGARWLSSVCGTAVNRANGAVTFAQPGEVLVCPETARIAGRAMSGEVQAEGFVRVMALLGRFSLSPALPPEPVALPPETLLPHLSPAIRQRLAAGLGSWLAEFRRVSVLFVHVPDREESQPRMDERQQLVRHLQEVLGRFEGMIDNLDDEKAGLTLVAGFGLPPLAHEDDAGRAVQAALAIQRELSAQALEGSIGIASGEIFCGAIGGSRRRAYVMIGDAVNRCARLMELAVNEILCDEVTAAAAGRQIRFEPVRQVTLRGTTQRVEIHRPLGDQARRPLEISGIVGRQVERLAIELRLARLTRGERTGPVLIEAEPGLGKSTLLAATVERAAASGILTLFGGAESGDRTRSYAAWPGIFQAFFGLRPEEEDRAEQAAAVLAGLDSELPLAPLLPIFNPVLGLDLPENPHTAPINAQSRAEIIADTLVRLLRRAAGVQPVLLALDDCQWLNPASWDLLEIVRERVPEVFCVFAARPFAEGAAPEAWRRAAAAVDADRLRLAPLPAPDAEALICHAYRVASIPAALAEFVARRAEGHPLFIESLAFALRDAGHVVVEKGACRLPPHAGRLELLRFPETVRGVIRARIDRLEPGEQLAMKVASVIGRSFSIAALAAIYPVAADRVRVPQMVSRLVALDLLALDPRHPEKPCSFAHAIVQETAYEMMLFEQRQRLHGDFAEWLETGSAGEAVADFPALAHHWAQAEVPAKAIEYAEKAGREAFARFANREASALFEQALARSTEPQSPEECRRQAGWHLALGEAHFHLGVLDSSQHHLHRAIELFGLRPPPRQVFGLRGLPAALFRQAWNRLRPGRRRPEPHDPAALAGAIRAFNLLGEMAFFRSDLPRATFCCIHGLNLAERLQEPAKLAEMLAATMIVAAAIPLRALGDLYLRTARRVVTRCREPVTEAYVQYLAGLYATGLAEWEECDAALEKARAAFVRHGNARRLDECRCTMIYSRLHRGQMPAAGEIVAQMLESSERRRDAQTSGWARAMAAQHALATAGPAAALEILGPDPSVAIDMLTRIPYFAVRAVALARLGRDAEARVACVEAVRVIAAVPPASAHMVPSAGMVAEAALNLWERARGTDAGAEMERLARRACWMVRLYGWVFPVGRAQAALWLGVCDLLRGRVRRGRGRLHRAVRIAERAGLRHDAAWARGQLARFGGASAEAGADRAEAVRLFRAAGAEADAARATAPPAADGTGDSHFPSS